jgi:NADH-quinone oxidoreductase subunit J
MEMSMLAGYIIFGILALVAVATALAMLFTRQPVYAVLFLVINFITVAVLYLILGAPFLALAQVTVYAGAIMVLFLFVVMMLGTEKMSFIEPLKSQRWLVGGLAFLFLLLIGIFLFTQMGAQPGLSVPQADFASPLMVGSVLMEDFVLPIMVIGVILLIATIGAVILTRQGDRQLPMVETAAEAAADDRSTVLETLSPESVSAESSSIHPVRKAEGK